ncbi:MAG TPA: hypothetical protein VHQ23_08980 [Ilumatobacteraceae bacterium]|nr:hypothetical protein [Ilumatobacteraceae bacterium]
MAVHEFSDASALSSPPSTREGTDGQGPRDRCDAVAAAKADQFGIAAHWARGMRG